MLKKNQFGIEYQIQYLSKKGNSPDLIRKKLKKLMCKTRVPSLKVKELRKPSIVYKRNICSVYIKGNKENYQK